MEYNVLFSHSIKIILGLFVMLIVAITDLEFWKKKDVVLIGNPDLTELYEYILRNRVNSIKFFLSKDMVLKGLKNFKNKLS